MDAERLPVTADQVHRSLSGPTRPSAVPRSDSRTRPWWQGRSRAASRSSVPSSYSSSRAAASTSSLGHPRVARVGLADGLAAVLLRVETDGRRLDPQRQVFRDQRDVATLVGEVAGDRQDAGVVVAEPEPRPGRVGHRRARRLAVDRGAGQQRLVPGVDRVLRLRGEVRPAGRAAGAGGERGHGRGDGPRAPGGCSGPTWPWP